VLKVGLLKLDFNLCTGGNFQPVFSGDAAFWLRD